MAIKDYHAGENKTTVHSPVEAPPPPKNAARLQIKNAHATGDGSYGRSDESLPDEPDAKDRLPDNSY